MKPLFDKDIEKVDPDSLKLLDLLIHKIIEGLEDRSYQPRIQDALKAIQLRGKVAKASEGEKIFWDMIEEIKQEELPKMYPQAPSLEDQIRTTIVGLRPQVENGALPVKLIADALNQGRGEESQLTYRRVGQLLSEMGFRKARTHNGSYAILWDDNLLSPPVADREQSEKESLPAGRAVSPGGDGTNCPTIGCGRDTKQSLPSDPATRSLPCCPTLNPQKNEKNDSACLARPARPASPAVSSFRWASPTPPGRLARSPTIEPRS